MIWRISPAGVQCHETNHRHSPLGGGVQPGLDFALCLGHGKAPSSTSALSGGSGLWEASPLGGL